MNYLNRKNSFRINEISKKEFCKYSLCPQDYKALVYKNQNLITLNDLLISRYTGKEIGSDNYMKMSKYKFLKTVNITESFILDRTSIEYCKPSLGNKPKSGSILIVKDGAGDGLGQVGLYLQDDKENKDYISAGLIGIEVKEFFKYYILGILKSQFFRDYININTAQGSTIRHSKLIALDFPVPFPTENNNNNPDKVQNLVSVLTQNIINKEQQIILNSQKINLLIENELNINTRVNLEYSFPNRVSLLNVRRLDTSLYTKRYLEENNKIESYYRGYYQIPFSLFKSGSTPETRIINGSKSILKWVTPTNISDEGFFNPIDAISMPTGNNIKKDCILFINRTSKGKRGEFVGITCYYDTSYYGKGHHNQGIYRLEELAKEEMLFLTAFMNSNIMRKICGCFSNGSKMKEMKVSDFANLKFPNFDTSLKKKIGELYYKTVEKEKHTIESYLEKERLRNTRLGIFQLHQEIIEEKKRLNDIIDKIIKEEPISIDF